MESGTSNVPGVPYFASGTPPRKMTASGMIGSIKGFPAIAKMYRHDKRRKVYHNRYSKGKWGDSRNYDLCVKSSALGVEKTVDSLIDIIQKRFA